MTQKNIFSRKVQTTRLGNAPDADDSSDDDAVSEASEELNALDVDENKGTY